MVHFLFYIHAGLKLNQVSLHNLSIIDSRQIGLPRMIKIQVIDVNKDGIVDIKEYIVVTSLSSYLYKNSAVDYNLLDSKLQSLRVTRSLISCMITTNENINFRNYHNITFLLMFLIHFLKLSMIIFSVNSTS